MKVYLNLKTSHGIETVDELNFKDFKTTREFKNEVKRLINEYHLAGMSVYRSSRCTNDWKNR